MSIQTPLKPSLQTQIEAAFKNAKDNGSVDGASPDTIIKTLAKEIADAIDSYAKGMVITVNVQPGQTVSTSSGQGLGSTTTPGIGTS